ncbi:hypothetical protein CK203_007090 [Vitis vinifera]|uniref:Retrotransposon gag domain-containing protein n=1 Tax=Vitis vinifera TaxID=29760 RepID=A0A438KBY2_VITVI|nr:hypothetical protein CK203_007090 [Vitis vinifera]
MPPSPIIQHHDEGSWIGRASDDYSFPTIFEWGGPALVCILEASRRRTWDDLAQEFLRQFSFNTVVDVSRRELEALRQRSDESVSSFISRWRGKIAEIIDRPSERDQIQMVLRSLQPRIARHVDRGRQMLVLSVHPVRGLLGAISRSHSFPSLIRPMHLISTGHGHLDQLMIRHILRKLWLCLIMPPRALRDPGFLHGYRTAMLCCSVHCETRSALSPTQSSADFCSLCFEAQRQFSQIGMPLSQALRKLTKAGLLTTLTPRPPPQPIPPQFRMDLHCAYHQGPGHETDRCTALRHAIQDLIDQVPPPADGIHFLEFDVIDDHIHMLSDDDSDPEPIMPDVIYETSGVTMGPRMPAPFRLVPEAAPVQAATVEPLILPHYSVQTPFILIPDVEGVQALYVDDSQTLDIQYVLRGGRVMRQPPPAAAARPLGIRVDTTTTPEGLIHMMTADRATCIVFSDDDLPLEGSGHTCPLYISIGCSGRRVPSVLLDNGSALNVCPLTTVIALGYAPSDFGPPLRPFELMTAPVERIPASFNLLLGRPWIHRAGAIPSSLHQKVKFIHESQVVVVQSAGDMFISAEPVLQISHSDDDLLLTGFTFDEVQTLELGTFAGTSSLCPLTSMGAQWCLTS